VLRPDLDDTVAPALRTDADVAAGAQRIERFLRDWFAGTLRLPPEALDAERSFGELGVDSVAAVELAQALSARVGREVSPSALWTWRTPAALSRHLAERVEA
jgi:acyl carrier protein